MKVSFLGPLRVTDDSGNEIAINGPKPRALLTVLAVEPGKTVDMTRVCDALWDENAMPRDVGHNVQTHVATLRRAIGRDPDGEQFVERVGNGYVLHIDQQDTDEDEARRLLHAARGMLDGGDAAAASDRLALAAGLWRGEPLADLSDRPLARPYITRLLELQLDIVKTKADADLALGLHGEAIGALRPAVAESPFDEGLLIRLARALAGNGRTDEALRELNAGLRRLRDERGIDVGALLTLQTEILQGRAAAVPRPPASQGVARLPPGARDFTGRTGDRRLITDLLTAPAGENATVIALSGMPGLGKTALAVRVAREVQAHYPDGVLYAELRGPAAERLDPARVLARLLNALGVARTVLPDDQRDLEGVFQDRLAPLRVLVVLDNAVDESQVRPLLPQAPGCAAIVTSRSRLRLLSDIPALHPLPLSAMRADAAIELLGRTAGPDRIAAEPEAAGTIAGLCSYLPLAICIAGRKLAARPNWPLTRLVSRLEDERARVPELSVDNQALAASFEVSYEERQIEEQRAFRLLSLLDVQDFAPWVAAAVLDRDPDEAEEILDLLVDANLLEQREDLLEQREDAGAVRQPRYRFHDLLRAFGRHQAEVEDPGGADRADAIARAINAYVAHARAAAALFDPGEPPLLGSSVLPPPGIDRMHISELVQRPITWYGTERINVVPVIAQALAHGLAEQTWLLAASMVDFFEITANRGDWLMSHQHGLDAARRAGNRLAEAVLLANLGRREIVMALETAVWRIDAPDGDSRPAAGSPGQRHLVRADEWCGKARALFLAEGNEVGAAQALVGLAETKAGSGRRREAIGLFQEAVHVFQRHGSRVSEAHALTRLGAAYGELEEYDNAVVRLDKALDIVGDLGHRWLETAVRLRLGTIRAKQGRHMRGLESYDRAIPLLHELPDPLWAARAHFRRGDILARAGDPLRAMEAWQQAASLFTVVGSTEAGVVARRLNHPEQIVAEPEDRRLLSSLPHTDIIERIATGDLIRISATWSDLLLVTWAERFETALTHALTNGATARIMLLDPTCEPVVRRQADLVRQATGEPIDVAANIRENLRRLRDVIRRLDEPMLSRLAVRVQRRQPSVYYRCDTIAYLAKQVTDNPLNTAAGEQWQLSSDNDQAREQEDLFLSLWNDQTTLTLRDFDAVRMRVRQRDTSDTEFAVPWLEIGDDLHIVANDELSRLLRADTTVDVLLLRHAASESHQFVRAYPGAPIARARLHAKYDEAVGEVVRLEFRERR